MIKKLFIAILIIALVVLVVVFVQTIKKPSSKPTHTPSQPIAGFNYLPTTKEGQIIKHEYFTLSYAEKHEQAEWVAYELTKMMVKNGELKRNDDFRPDPDVSTRSATPEDYSNSGYDRGHLVPAGDMEFSMTAMSETFYMSNMSPQDPAFNRGVWKHLEEQARKWSIQNEKIYIVTGGVLTDGLPTIGRNKVSVPRYFYKIILDYEEPGIKAISFLIPNERSKKPLNTFVVSIDSVEALTGIDFFPALPDKLENELEKTSNLRQWSKKK
ncbi:MAG: DNA/RNA non-specific endonuclease [Chlorobiales bacterium]|nr:DNA/RNA non-specific endonuclease [Chlorobiales bacterium]